MIIVAIGSNLESNMFGCSINICNKSVELIRNHGVQVVDQSSWYETAPIPASLQPNYINGVISVQTQFSSEELLLLLLSIEKKMGRVRTKRNAARVIDLDLICYNDEVVRSKGLTLPHSKLSERVFVVKPISEIAPNWKHPVSGLMVDEILLTLSNQKIRQLSN